MRRRRLTVLLLALAALVPAYAAAQPDTVPQAAAQVRSAIPAIEVYRIDRGTYVGLTLAKIRSYDRAVRGVTVKRAGKNGYCIQSTRPGPVVHYDGPAGPVRKGRCGVSGAVVPRPAPKPSAPAERLRAATFAIELYRAANDGFAGMTLAKLRAWDAGLEEITIVWSTPREFCIESTAGAVTYHLRGPANPPVPGPCPPAP